MRYWVHLVAPGWDVLGGGEPSLPGISIGHNQHGAWGLTIFGTDTEDLYVYDSNPENPSQYKYRGAWEPMTTIKESVPVKGESPVTVELKYTRHGPVVFEDKQHHKAYAVRAAWREIGAAPYLASLRMDQATTWKEFRDACTYSRMPSENIVWVDKDPALVTRPSVSPPVAPTGVASCRCLATGVMSGIAFYPSRICLMLKTRRRDSSTPPTTI